MNTQPDLQELAKLATGINGFDLIAAGGLPKARTTLVAGSAGSGKTVFACQYLAQGIRDYQENGVFVTFEETPPDICRNMLSLGWEIKTWERERRWAFVDVSPNRQEPAIVTGDYDLGALLARIEHAIRSVDAKRVAIDAFGAIFSQFQEIQIIRRELLRIGQLLKSLGVTTLITTERDHEYGAITRFGVEEFVADNVVILRNILEDQIRHRTIEILKFRGAYHHKGEFPFTVTPDQGIVAVPLSAITLDQGSTDIRISSGNDKLDAMCGGGLFRDSITLVSGATGTGKTLMVTEFLNGGCTGGERCLLLAFEESNEQLHRNALGWGVDFKQFQSQARLRIISTYPESATLEDHLANIKRQIEDFKPDRIALDSISALEPITSKKGFREFVISLASFIKSHQLAALFTATTPDLTGSQSVTDGHISTLTDAIILLRYVEAEGEIKRAITVLKMRGSAHEKTIREFTIDNTGMHIGEPLRRHADILTHHSRT